MGSGRPRSRCQISHGQAKPTGRRQRELLTFISIISDYYYISSFRVVNMQIISEGLS